MFKLTQNHKGSTIGIALGLFVIPLIELLQGIPFFVGVIIPYELQYFIGSSVSVALPILYISLAYRMRKTQKIQGKNQIKTWIEIGSIIMFVLFSMKFVFQSLLILGIGGIGIVELFDYPFVIPAMTVIWGTAAYLCALFFPVENEEDDLH